MLSVLWKDLLPKIGIPRYQWVTRSTNFLLNKYCQINFLYYHVVYEKTKVDKANSGEDGCGGLWKNPKAGFWSGPSYQFLAEKSNSSMAKRYSKASNQDVQWKGRRKGKGEDWILTTENIDPVGFKFIFPIKENKSLSRRGMMVDPWNPSKTFRTQLVLWKIRGCYLPEDFGKDKSFLFENAVRTWIHLSTCSREWQIINCDFLPLPASAEGFLFQSHIKTKSEDDDHLSITNCNLARLAKLTARWFQEVINARLTLTFLCLPIQSYLKLPFSIPWILLKPTSY